MKVLISTLKEELETVKRLEKRYADKISDLPKGSLVVRKVRDGSYAYLTYREGTKVKQKYLGKADPDLIKSYRDKITKRKNYKRKLASMREQKKILRKALRGKSK